MWLCAWPWVRGSTLKLTALDVWATDLRAPFFISIPNPSSTCTSDLSTRARSPIARGPARGRGAPGGRVSGDGTGSGSARPAESGTGAATNNEILLLRVLVSRSSNVSFINRGGEEGGRNRKRAVLPLESRAVQH